MRHSCVFQQDFDDPPEEDAKCVADKYNARANFYRESLADEALAEARLTPEEMVRIQDSLISLGFLDGESDGIFGSETRTAVRDFQRSLGHRTTNFLNADERERLLYSTDSEVAVAAAFDREGKPENLPVRPVAGGEIDAETLEGTIREFECGDNCYLKIIDGSNREQTGLCTAPECEKWNEDASMPSRYKGARVIVTVGEGIQVDGEGNFVAEMLAFSKIQFLDVEREGKGTAGFTYSGWVGLQSIPSNKGEFEGCLMTKAFRNFIEFGAISATNGNFGRLAFRKSWQLTPKAEIHGAARFDNSPSIPLFGSVMENGMVFLRSEDNVLLREAVRDSGSLSLTFETISFQLELTGSLRAVELLDQCTQLARSAKPEQDTEAAEVTAEASAAPSLVPRQNSQACGRKCSTARLVDTCWKLVGKPSTCSRELLTAHLTRR